MTNEELSDEVEYLKFAVDSLVDHIQKIDSFLQKEIVTQVDELSSAYINNTNIYNKGKVPQAGYRYG